MYEAMTRAYHENNAMRNREKEKVITRKEFEKIVQSMIDKFAIEKQKRHSVECPFLKIFS